MWAQQQETTLKEPEHSYCHFFSNYMSFRDIPVQWAAHKIGSIIWSWEIGIDSKIIRLNNSKCYKTVSISRCNYWLQKKKKIINKNAACVILAFTLHNWNRNHTILIKKIKKSRLFLEFGDRGCCWWRVQKRFAEW